MVGMDLLAILGQSGDGNRVILESSHEEYTFSQLQTLCTQLEQTLVEIDVDLLALHAENIPYWVVADLVCQKLDICLVPLPTFFSPLQLKAALGQCQARYLLTDRPGALEPLIESEPAPADGESGLALCRVIHIEGEAPLIPDNTGKITFTSGSTGEAKGVCLSNKQLFQQARALAEVVGLKSPRHLCLLPLSTLLENVAGVYAPLLAGGRVIVPSLADLGYLGSRLVAPEKMLDLIQKAAPDSIILIPELLKLLVSAAGAGWKAPASFKFIAVGGSRVSSALLEQAWSLGLPVYEGYGLSECASVVSLNTPEARRDGSCGKVLPHLDVQFVEGEIMVKGNAMLGYLNEPESWMPSRIQTGDLGYLDGNGFLHLEGRRKNVLISSYGRNISPEWPESELLANPGLQDAVVFGDARPYCIALISSRDPNLDDKAIQVWIDQVNSGLPDYAQVRVWHRLNQPLGHQPGMLTQNGRPRRGAIARHFAAEIEALYSPERAKISMSTAAKEMTI